MTAPASPLTYEQATAAAKALHSALTPAPSPTAAVANMAEQIIATRENTAAWAKTAIRGLWAAVDPYSPAQVKAFSEQAAALMDSAQTAAARVAAAGQAQQLAAAGILVDAAPSNPVDVRAPGAVVKGGQLVLHRHASSVDYAGPGDAAKVSKADMTTAGVFARPAAVFRYAESQDVTDAADQALQRIDSLVDDNLMLAQRLAQQQVLVQAVNLDHYPGKPGGRATKVIGYRRVIHPELSRTGVCGMCIAASDRIYHVGQLLPIHAHCKCTIAAVTTDFDPADDLNAVDLNALYKAAGGTSVAHLKRTRYQVDEHGELGPVLVPKAKYKPRTTKSKVRVGGTALLTDQPAQADVARHQIGQVEANLAKMRADGVPEDSSKIAYHLKLIAKLQAQLADSSQ
jgi:hypothetical protein